MKSSEYIPFMSNQLSQGSRREKDKHCLRSKQSCFETVEIWWGGNLSANGRAEQGSDVVQPNKAH